MFFVLGNYCVYILIVNDFSLSNYKLITSYYAGTYIAKVLTGEDINLRKTQIQPIG